MKRYIMVFIVSLCAVAFASAAWAQPAEIKEDVTNITTGAIDEARQTEGLVGGFGSESDDPPAQIQIQRIQRAELEAGRDLDGDGIIGGDLEDDGFKDEQPGFIYLGYGEGDRRVFPAKDLGVKFLTIDLRARVSVPEECISDMGGFSIAVHNGDTLLFLLPEWRKRNVAGGGAKYRIEQTFVLFRDTTESSHAYNLRLGTLPPEEPGWLNPGARKGGFVCDKIIWNYSLDGSDFTQLEGLDRIELPSDASKVGVVIKGKFKRRVSLMEQIKEVWDGIISPSPEAQPDAGAVK